MKTGILYICTGNYVIFWDDFYLSCEKNFFPEDERDYFVFTDGNINTYDNPKVKVIYQKKLGWPFDTLKRFEMFLSVEDDLKKMDYLFFFNANIIVNKRVDGEILPEAGQELTVALHPDHYMSESVDKYPYERNPESFACIPVGAGKFYVQGCFIGGSSENFLKMCKQLHENTEKDLKNNIIALWHDESHLNKYVLDKNVKLLTPNYICPEGRKFPGEIYMYTRKKKKYGGHKKLRGELIKNNSVKSKILKLFKWI